MLEIIALNKSYPNGTMALSNISFKINQGEFIAIIGLSGAGKSTLLRSINQLHQVNSGAINFDGKNITELQGVELRKIRTSIGMIFQHFNLIPRKTVLENVLIGNLSQTGIIKSIFGIHTEEAQNKAKKYLEIVGLSGKEELRADNLSGGEKQRVAIARALMQNPKILLADEPVASLDPATSHSVMQYLKKVNEELGVTVICNLHFISLVRQYSHRVIALKTGEVVFDGKASEIDDTLFKTIYGEDAVPV